MLRSLVFHKGFIMRVFLAFVFVWFGISEIADPTNWISYMPSFISNWNTDSNFLVQIHGAVLVFLSFCLVFKFYLRFTSFLMVLVMLQITFGLFLINKFEFNEIIVRDIGLLGLAIGIWLNET